MHVFVLLFNAGTENEGIHTIRIGDRNLVLMFEQEDDATRYALLLEAQDFPYTPSVEGISQQEIEQFCQEAGYDCQIVPAGFVPQNDADRLLLVPPETNLNATDWQLEAKEDLKEDLKEAAPKNEEMSADELEQIRRKLEGLL
jgi:hypothetical protein